MLCPMCQERSLDPNSCKRIFFIKMNLKFQENQLHCQTCFQIKYEVLSIHGNITFHDLAFEHLCDLSPQHFSICTQCCRHINHLPFTESISPVCMIFRLFLLSQENYLYSLSVSRQYSTYVSRFSSSNLSSKKPSSLQS